MFASPMSANPTSASLTSPSLTSASPISDFAEAASRAASYEASAEAPSAPSDGARLARQSAPSTDARAALLEKFKWEQLIVAYLNRGVSVGEIAARVGFSEQRMGAVVHDILARRMPAPEDFAAIQASRLNEALLVAVSAMTDMNLRAVDRVIRIVRDLDRYHGFGAAGRRLTEPSRLGGPADGALPLGGALVSGIEPTAPELQAMGLTPVLAPEAARPQDAPQAFAAAQATEQSRPDERRRLPVDLTDLVACHPRESEDPEPRLGRLPDRRGSRASRPEALGAHVRGQDDGGFERPQNLPQGFEKMESASRIAEVADIYGGVDAAPEAAFASTRLEPTEGGPTLNAPINNSLQNWPQSIENLGYAPGSRRPAHAPSFPAAVAATCPSPIGAGPSLRAILSIGL